MNRLHATVTGRVQGVGFRYFVKSAAQQLELTGYVRNLPNGDVEIVAEGSTDAVEELRMRLWKGPMFSNVVNVIEETSETVGEYSKFEIR